MDAEEQNQGLETPLLVSVSEENKDIRSFFGVDKDDILVEARKQLSLAAPLISINIFLCLILMISAMFIGHVSELALSGAAMASSFATVTGSSLLLGLGCTLDTFCGQSYGAKNYQMLGIHAQRAMAVLLLVCIPIVFIWYNAGDILVFLGQNQEISAEAGLYARFMIPSVFSLAVLQCLFRFLQTQGLVLPLMLSTGLTTLLHLPICWFLVFKTGLQSKGAAVANGISYWLNCFLLAIYIKFSPSCNTTWTGFSKEAFHDVVKFLRLAVPSAIMMCVESWSIEMVVLLAGLLPDPELETSVLSISLNINAICYMIHLGFAAALSIRVSNELGAARPRAARLAIGVAISMVAAETTLVVIAMILGRKVWGSFYIKEERIVKYVGEILLFSAALQFPNAIQTALTGIARGCGWQKNCAIANVGAYYLVGIPFGILLAFVYHIGGKGLWAGLLLAISVQALFLVIITAFSSLDKEAKKASARVFDSMIPVQASSH